jgi:protein deglycase
MKVLIVLYNGFTEYEYLIPLMALHHQKVPFDVVGLDQNEITGMTGLKALTTMKMDQIDPADYDALLLPGIDRELREETLKNETLIATIRQFDQDNKLIAAICAAPTFLGAAGILQGRRFCSEIQDHPSFEPLYEHLDQRCGMVISSLALGHASFTLQHCSWRHWLVRKRLQATGNGQGYDMTGM